jgi:hypothetical protein
MKISNELNFINESNFGTLKYLQRVMNPIYKNHKCEMLPLANCVL